MTSSLLIREATVDDAASVARVRIETWRNAYAGIIPAEYLANLCYEDDAQRLRERLKTIEPKCFLLVAEIQGEIVGFASGGPERGGDKVYKGEIYALYVLPAYQGRGIGKKLVGASARRLIQAGIGNLLVWVLSANPFRRFYETLGGQLVREREIEIGGVLLKAVGYGWPDLGALASIGIDEKAA
ncbi:MAG: GNAT family N-acetyltransferase [Roseiflexus sp.]|jgi:ribosomal protein S18 acetylase RimI-like enzyme|uniref:GNAT family N-acetyltransferase n=1 Tax=Roseiflexus sp. TaxID=2562120 RepID=UPI0025F5201D|nr:GNAT family N-acetyltransferase [Roseiflexus sp.]MCL6542913.1 GNAT family N-acetyltransferase [Roseiflexus sp.]